MKKKTFPRLKNPRGFTLIELMVVIVILGILAGVLLPKIMGRPDEAKQLKAKMQIQSLETALKMYRLDNDMYPTTEQGHRTGSGGPGGDARLAAGSQGLEIGRIYGKEQNSQGSVEE